MKNLLRVITASLTVLAATVGFATENPTNTNPFTPKTASHYGLERIFHPLNNKVCYRSKAYYVFEQQCAIASAFHKPGKIHRITETIPDIGNNPVYYDEGFQLLITKVGTAYRLKPASRIHAFFEMRHANAFGVHRYFDPFHREVCYKSRDTNLSCVPMTTAYPTDGDIQLVAKAIPGVEANAIYYDSATRLVFTKQGDSFHFIPTKTLNRSQSEYLNNLAN